jgi:hypothetical protein
MDFGCALRVFGKRNNGTPKRWFLDQAAGFAAFKTSSALFPNRTDLPIPEVAGNRF